MPKIFEELDRQVDKWEPTAAAISLGSLGLGAGISTTAVGAPIGGIIAGVGQLPSLVIDGYQAGTRLLKNPQVILEMPYGILWKLGQIYQELNLHQLQLREVLIFLDLAYTNLVITLNIILQDMRKRQVDVVLNQQKKEATKKLAKKGVRPSQGSYFTSKLNQELNRSYLEQVAKRNTIIANDVIKLSPKIQLPIQIIPNIIDIHARNK